MHDNHAIQTKLYFALIKSHYQELNFHLIMSRKLQKIFLSLKKLQMDIKSHINLIVCILCPYINLV